MKKLPIGIQTFQKIREDDYVDKTDLAVQLIDRYQYVCLSRPRRFGKSLFVDTLHNIFEGKKNLYCSPFCKGLHNQTYILRAQFSFKFSCIKTHQVAANKIEHGNRCIYFKWVEHQSVVYGICCSG